MSIVAVLQPEAVVLDLKAADKTKALTELAERVAARAGLDAKAVLKAILDRETLGSTGFGGGVAVPHARLKGLGRAVAAFARLAKPVDYHAVDDQPVDLIFMLVTPEGDNTGHLGDLAQVSRIMRNAGCCTTLRCSASSDEVHRLLTQPTQPG